MDKKMSNKMVYKFGPMEDIHTERTYRVTFTLQPEDYNTIMEEIEAYGRIDNQELAVGVYPALEEDAE